MKPTWKINKDRDLLELEFDAPSQTTPQLVDLKDLAHELKLSISFEVMCHLMSSGKTSYEIKNGGLLFSSENSNLKEFIQIKGVFQKADYPCRFSVFFNKQELVDLVNEITKKLVNSSLDSFWEEF